MTIRQKVLHWGVLPTVLALTTFAFPLSAIDNGASGLGVACACEQGVGCVEAWGIIYLTHGTIPDPFYSWLVIARSGIAFRVRSLL